MITKLLESNVTQLNIRSPDAEKMKWPNRVSTLIDW
jgi:hypothetical protein